MNGSMFLDYIQHELVPSLHTGDLVIMDNLRCHTVKGVKEAIQQTGTQLLYLPPYSPDFNPIEMMWSKLKAILRKVKARTVDSLLDLRGLTCLVVTHRYNRSLLQRYDQIIALKDGRVAETGTFDGLMKKKATSIAFTLWQVKTRQKMARTVFHSLRGFC